jgi:cytochrome b involved in lipid metabolism
MIAKSIADYKQRQNSDPRPYEIITRKISPMVNKQESIASVGLDTSSRFSPSSKHDSTARQENTSRFPLPSKQDSIARKSPGKAIPTVDDSARRHVVSQNDSQPRRQRAPSPLTPDITPLEVSQHSTKHDLWVTIHDKVYNVTSFVDEHPGGEEVLLDVAGQDATEAFEDVGHSEEAREILSKLFVANLSKQVKTERVNLSRRPYDPEQLLAEKNRRRASERGAGWFSDPPRKRSHRNV